MNQILFNTECDQKVEIGWTVPIILLRSSSPTTKLENVEKLLVKSSPITQGLLWSIDF